MFGERNEGNLSGLKALTKEPNRIAKACAGTEVILSGHSQGAYVIDELTDSKSNYNQLTPQAQIDLVGIALLGDPSYQAGEKIDAHGNGTTDADGVGARRTMCGVKTVPTKAPTAPTRLATTLIGPVSTTSALEPPALSAPRSASCVSSSDSEWTSCPTD